MRRCQRIARFALASSCLVLFLGACDDAAPEETASSIFAPLGDPLPSLNDEERAAFERGRDLALRHLFPEDGLGPEFNVSFCGGCHEKPVLGGSAGHYRDFPLVGDKLLSGRIVPTGKNGVQRQFSLETGRDPSSTLTNTTAPRNPIPFFGAGLLLEIPEEEILSRADPDDLDGDGISGQANIVDGVVGRFGRKAQTASLEIFIRGPLFNHMGISTQPLSAARRAELPITAPGSPSAIAKQSVLPDEDTFDDDAAPDPELSEDQLFDLVSFAMTLAAPMPSPRNAQTDRGSALFEEIGCAACHVPALEGPRGPIPAYSDLLLHEMGEALADDFNMGEAWLDEFRTQPLWGVAAAAPYLHDGRAGTLDEAIRWHGGEAQASADAYAGFSDEDRDAVLAFLRSLGGEDQATAGLLPPGAPIREPGSYGGPVAALDDDALARFERGRAAFDRDMSFSEGVGPSFNGDSCRGCHFMPVIGGAGPSGVDAMRQGIVGPGDTFQAPVSGTGILRHSRFEAPQRPEPDPASNFFEPRQTPPVFGLGLIESIPREIIEANADPTDVDSDGIAGRAHVLADGQLGRFGWKANVPSVREFVRDALTNELGITLPDEPGFSFGSGTDADSVPDPEVDANTIDAITDYLQLLGPPPRNRQDPAREDLGENIFETVGCGDCHVPAMQTTEGTEVRLYSDLLLHDVSDGQVYGIVEGDAGMRDFRTAPLWGISQTPPYMHDGRASTIEAAVAAHGGEAAASRAQVSALDAEARASLLAFLRSL